MSSAVRVAVVGLPQPQGSKRMGRHGSRFVILENNDTKLRPWRQLVTGVARQAMVTRTQLVGPVLVEMVFTMPRPKSAPKRRFWPDRRPDLSKLIRAVEDALTDARVWVDDGQVCQIVAAKRYVGDPNATSLPGVVVDISSLSQGVSS